MPRACNQTKQDASDRVTQAQVGSLAGNPSLVYLEQLRKLVYKWLANIDEEIVAACTREHKESEDDDDKPTVH